MVHTQIRSKATTIRACMSQNHLEYYQAHFGLLYFFVRNFGFETRVAVTYSRYERSQPRSVKLDTLYIISPFCVFVIRRLVLDDMSKLVHIRMGCLFITWHLAFGITC